MKKICLIGSAPSSVALAPYRDPSWELWSCSPGARPHLARTPDRHFELHNWDYNNTDWNSPEYTKFMAGMAGPVYTLEPVEGLPTCTPYPKEEVMRHYGPAAAFFYTSSLSWMFALAILERPDEIALYGVDMSASEEIYLHQRAGCHYWIGKAWEAGIKVTVPPQSDLMRPPALYGFCELDPMYQKLLARQRELEHRVAVATQQFKQVEHEMLYLRGAAEDVNYVKQTWVSDRDAIDMIYGATSRAAPALPWINGTPEVEIAAAEAVVAGAPTRATWGSTPAPAFVNGLD